MKARKLPSGNWNARVMIDGQAMSFTASTKKEAEKLATLATKKGSENITLGEAIDRYISSKTAVLSPSTIRGYRTIQRNNIDEKTKLTRLNNLTSEKIQRCVNECAKEHSPKTVANMHGLISATLKMFRPEFSPRVTLPAKERVEILIPTEKDIKLMMDAVRGTADELPFLISAFGSCRRSETAAIFPDCVFDDHIAIRRSIVLDEHNKWIVRKKPKSWAGYRDIYLPEPIMKKVREAAANTKEGEPIIGMNPQQLEKSWLALRETLGLPDYHLHSLRHYFATFSHYIGLSDKQIQEAGGWGDVSTLHRIYQHSMPEYRSEANKKVADYFNKMTSNE